ncbi:MAG: hypothetical protein Q8O67_32200 [Deltaproteobacteria bacterium]|nr:hypothetical protein [Deltaproteobacteria bacterium]
MRSPLLLAAFLVAGCGIPAGVPAEEGLLECSGDVTLDLCQWASLANAGVVGTVAEVRLVRDPCVAHEPGRFGRTIELVAPAETTDGTYALEVTLDVDHVLFGDVGDRVVVRFVEELWAPMPTGFYYRDGRAPKTVEEVQWTSFGEPNAKAGRLVPGVKVGLLLASIPGETWFTKVRPFLTVDDGGLLGTVPPSFSDCSLLLPSEIAGASADEARTALAACELAQQSIFTAIAVDQRFDVDLGTCEQPKVGSP